MPVNSYDQPRTTIYGKETTHTQEPKYINTFLPLSPDIYKLRTTMWNPVVSRAHNPIAVFPFTSSDSSTRGELEVMLHGTVSYTLADGRKCEDVEWAARGNLVDGEQGVRWSRYQVYMVCMRLRLCIVVRALVVMG